MKLTKILKSAKLILSYMRKNGFLATVITAMNVLRRKKAINMIYLNNVNTPGYEIFKSKAGLLITDCTIPQCLYYRVEQKTLLLSQNKQKLIRTSAKNTELIFNLMKIVNFMVIYRTPYSRRISKIIKAANKLGVLVLFETDDANFDWKILIRDQNFRKLNIRIKINLLRDSLRFRKLIRKSDGCIGSTENLCKLLEKVSNKPTLLFQNIIDSKQLETTASIVKLNKNFEGDNTEIYYSSGSNSHAYNFDIISKSLEILLKRNPNLILKVNEGIEIPHNLTRFSPQIKKLPWMHYNAHLNEIRNSRFVLNPLEKNQFNSCKSDIKELECAALGVPFIGSNNVYRGPFSADNDYQIWLQTMEDLLDDENPKSLESYGNFCAATIQNSHLLAQQLPKKFNEFLTDLMSVS